jgi:ADP-heptose:LPS heptosyltransferase
MSNYLIFKLGAFGDLSYLMPAISQIHQWDSQAKITWVVGKAYGQLLRKNPFIHHVIEVDERRLFSQHFWPRRLLERATEVIRLRRQLQAHHPYHQIWIGHRTRAAFFLARIGSFRFLRYRRVRSNQGKIFQLVRRPSLFLKYFRTEIITPPLERHESHSFKILAEAALARTISISAWKSVETPWIQHNPGPSPLTRVVVHIGGGINPKTEFKLKKWPYWAQLLKLFSETRHFTIYLIGSAEEEIEVETLYHQEPALKSQLHSFVGKTNLYQLLEILKGAQLFVGPDSGPLHWADFLQIPCIGIYGPTSPVSWGVLNKNSKAIHRPMACSPCYRDEGHFPECTNEHKCMRELSAQEVFNLCKQNFPTMLD